MAPEAGSDRDEPSPYTPGHDPTAAASIVVEGPLVAPREGTHALVVETERVVIGVANRGGARLLEVRDGEVRVHPWVRHDLTVLDADQRGAGRHLAWRAADREGTPWEPTSPWHVSRFEAAQRDAAPTGPSDLDANASPTDTEPRT